MAWKQKQDLFSLLREVGLCLGRGPRQGLVVRPGQNKILKILSHKGDNGTMRQQDLLKKLDIRAGSLSELLRKLEKDEYVERHRNPDNGSEILVTITEKGRISALENELSVKERDQELFCYLEADEKQELVRVLNKLLAAWKEEERETEGQHRERRWKEVAQMQDEQREIDALLSNVAQ